ALVMAELVVQLLAEGAQLRGVGAGQRHPRPLPRQRPRHGRADPAAGAGHEGGHSGKVEHAQISFASASMSAMVTTLIVRASGSVRPTIGPSTLPPSSTKRSIPTLPIATTLSRQR